MENQQHISNYRKEMEQELIKGHDSANQLLEVIVHKLNIINPHDHGDLEYAQDLINKVLRSFTNALFLLNTNNSKEEVFPITTINDLSPSKPQDMDKAYNTFKQQRGYNNKKSNEVSWEKDSSILIEDGYQWRKYGQKIIINAKYIRSYYRCSYRNEEECLAMKQVQRIEEDPPLYRTTYYGHHNCKNTSLLNSSYVTLLEPNINNSSSMFLSFNNDDSYRRKKQVLPISSTKQEAIDEVVINPYDGYDQNNQFLSNSCDHYELEFDDYLRHASTSSSSMLPSSTQSLQFHDYGF